MLQATTKPRVFVYKVTQDFYRHKYPVRRVLYKPPCEFEGQLAEKAWCRMDLLQYITYMNIRMSHSGSQAQYKGDTRNHAWQDPHVYVVFGGPKAGTSGLAAICMATSEANSSAGQTTQHPRDPKYPKDRKEKHPKIQGRP